jgi:hypothetical protein
MLDPGFREHLGVTHRHPSLEAIMDISSPLRSLVIGTLLAVAALGVPTLPAYAAKKAPDNLIRCADQNPETGEWVFYLPGETRTVDLGHGPITLVCGKDGHWVVEQRTAQPPQITAPASGAASNAP